jgi:hypothetical protein
MNSTKILIIVMAVMLLGAIAYIFLNGDQIQGRFTTPIPQHTY